MDIHGLQKLTLLDFPGHMSCTIFTGGCNFRCPFCHNGGLVLHPEQFPALNTEDIFTFLESRKKILEGVCITGGEPTLQPDLSAFITRIKDMGFKVKLDTNGQTPNVVSFLLEHGLVDYVAMDIKNCRERYGKTIGIEGFRTDAVEATASLLMASSIPYEFRTTVTKELHDREAFEQIAEWVAGAQHYFLQPYRDSEQIIMPNTFHTPSGDDLLTYREILRKTVHKVAIRGLD